MINLENLSNVAIEIYDENNNLIEKMGDLADIGVWLGGPNSPMEITFFPLDNEKIKEELKRVNIEYFSVKFIPFDNNYKELNDKAFMGIWFADTSLEKSKEIAKSLNIEYLFYSFWDGERIFIIDDVNSDNYID